MELKRKIYTGITMKCIEEIAFKISSQTRYAFTDVLKEVVDLKASKSGYLKADKLEKDFLN